MRQFGKEVKMTANQAMFTKLTDHASRRLENRTSMSDEEIRRILDGGLYVLLGGDHRKKFCAHKLFYSISDGSWFTAVQDERNRKVITICPADNNSEISPEALGQAREIMENAQPGHHFVPLVVDDGQKIRIIVYSHGSDSDEIRNVSVEVKGKKYFATVDPLEDDDDFLDEICGNLKKVLSPTDKILSATIKMSGKEKATFFRIGKIVARLRQIWNRDAGYGIPPG